MITLNDQKVIDVDLVLAIRSPVSMMFDHPRAGQILQEERDHTNTKEV